MSQGNKATQNRNNCDLCKNTLRVTRDECVLAFLKSVQNSYFQVDVSFNWEHRLAAINIPAKEFIETVKADVLSMLVRHSTADDCLLQWICNGPTSCPHNRKTHCGKHTLNNRRLVWMEYPFLVNLAAARRISNWIPEANEIIEYYQDCAHVIIKTFEKKDRDDTFLLIKSFCSFLNTLYISNKEDPAQVAPEIENCIATITSALKEITGNATRIEAWYSGCKVSLQSTSYFEEDTENITSTDSASYCRNCCKKAAKGKTTVRLEPNGIAIGKFSSFLVGAFLVDDELFEEVAKRGQHKG